MVTFTIFSNTIIDYCKDKASVYILRPKIKGQKVD